MSYLTLDEFEETAVSADLDAMLGDLSEAERESWIGDAITTAESDLNGYCLGRYGIPLVVTGYIRRVVFDLAWYLLCRRKDWNYTEAMQRDEKELRRRLELISARKFHLEDQAGASSVESKTSIRPTNPPARSTGRRRAFTRKSLGDF